MPKSELSNDQLRDRLAALQDRVEDLEDAVQEREEQIARLRWERGDPHASVPLAQAVIAFAEWQQEGYTRKRWDELSRQAVAEALWSDVSDRVHTITGQRPPALASLSFGS